MATIYEGDFNAPIRVGMQQRSLVREPAEPTHLWGNANDSEF